MSGIDILEFRQSLGLSQSEFADELGVTQPAVAQWETGVTRPRGSVLKMLDVLRGRENDRKKVRDRVDKRK